jgi:hypothetical protein
MPLCQDDKKTFTIFDYALEVITAISERLKEYKK